MTQEICDKAGDTCFFIFDSVPDSYNTQKICYKVASKECFMLKYCLDIRPNECVIKLLMLICQP